MPKRPINPQDLLREAADVIEEVMESLDISEKTCPTCHLPRRNRYREYTAHRSLEKMVSNLRSIASSSTFDGKTTFEGGHASKPIA